MHNLELLIAEWRKTMLATPNVDAETLDELENHLREIVGQNVSAGMTEAEAFARAVARFGSPSTIALEFQKLSPLPWLPARIVTGLGVAAALTLALFLLTHLHPGRSDVLLAAHVFSVTLGYTATLLLGVLGICYISQRCLLDFSPRRLRALSRLTFTAASVSMLFTAVGVGLGMIWSKREWGQFWGWDPKETGGLCVIVWLLLFLLAHRSRKVSARGLLVGSVLGGNVALLAWFGPHLFRVGLHSYGLPHGGWFVWMGLIANMVFFVVGLMPAGWLRLKEA